MKVIPPIAITDAMLTSSTAAEPGPAETAWAATTIYGAGQTVYIGAPSNTVTISVASPGIVSWASNGLAVDTPVVLSVSGGGALPAPFVAGTTYYIAATPTTGTFSLSASIGGAVITTTNAGSGTFTATAPVHRVFEALLGQFSTVTITVAAPGVVTYANHGFVTGTPIVFTNVGGALPTGLNAGQTYYAIPVDANSFQVAAVLGGTGITTTGAGSGVNTCGLASGYGKPPMLNIGTSWADAGPTNKWAMFDYRDSVKTSVASPLTVVITPGQRFDSIGFVGLVGNTLTITVTSVAGGGTVYGPKVINLDTRSVTNWYEYFFAAFSTKEEVALFDLPPFIDAVITITVAANSGYAGCRACVLGLQQDLGSIKYTAQSDALNFSVVDRAADGSATMTVARNVPVQSYEARVNKTEIDRNRKLRADLDGTVALYCGLDDTTDGYFGAFVTLGFPRKWLINAELPKVAKVNYEIEGF